MLQRARDRRQGQRANVVEILNGREAETTRDRQDEIATRVVVLRTTQSAPTSSVRTNRGSKEPPVLDPLVRYGRGMGGVSSSIDNKNFTSLARSDAATSVSVPVPALR